MGRGGGCCLVRRPRRVGRWGSVGRPWVLAAWRIIFLWAGGTDLPLAACPAEHPLSRNPCTVRRFMAGRGPCMALALRALATIPMALVAPAFFMLVLPAMISYSLRAMC